MWNSHLSGVKYFYPIKPNNQRHTTDRYCFILYGILSLIALSSLFYSFILQKDANFLRPMDPNGRYCGTGDTVDYPYIYFIDPNPSFESMKKVVCVNSCPKSSSDSNIKCLSNKEVPSCQKSLQFYETRQNNIRMFCQPTSETLRTTIQNHIIGSSPINKTYFEGKLAIFILCPALCIAIMLLQLLLVYSCNNLKGLFVLNFVAFLLVLAYLGFRVIFLNQNQQFQGYWIIGGIMVGASIIIIIYVLIHYSVFIKSLEYLNICSEFILENKRLIFLPLAMFAAWILSFGAALTVFVFIFALGSINYMQNQEYVSPFQMNDSNGPFIIILFALVLIHYVWTCLIIQHFGKYVAIVGASNWLMHAPRHFKNALFTLCKYHLGSILTGSFLITSFSWLAQLLYFFVPDRHNALLCCHFPQLNSLYRSSCFQKYIGACTEMTYLKIGLDGSSFFKAGQNMTPYLVKNVKTLSDNYKLSRLIVQSCQLFVAFMTTVICFEFLLSDQGGSSNIILVAIVFLISMLLSSFGQDPYTKAYQTLLLTVIINRDLGSRKRRRDSIAQFPSVKSLAEDGRTQIYQKICQWIDEQSAVSEVSSNSNERKFID